MVSRSCGCPIDAAARVRNTSASRRDLALARAERRDREHARVQPEEEILPEALLDDALLEIAVRRGDHAHVDLALGRGADAAHRVILEHAQQLRLHRHRELADLVEEERAALRGLDEPRLRGRGAGERALLVAEELALDELIGERRGVHADERPAAPARDVDGAREDLLAAAGLADEEHVDAALRDAARLVVELQHRLVDDDGLLGRVGVVFLRGEQRLQRGLEQLLAVAARLGGEARRRVDAREPQRARRRREDRHRLAARQSHREREDVVVVDARVRGARELRDELANRADLVPVLGELNDEDARVR